MEREELPTLSSSHQKRAGNLSFSISNILNNESHSEPTKEEHSDEVSEDEELEDNSLRIPQVQRTEANFSNLQDQMVSPELTPWLYRPTPLPGYLPLQTSFLTSRFAGMYKIVL